MLSTLKRTKRVYVDCTDSEMEDDRVIRELKAIRAPKKPLSDKELGLERFPENKGRLIDYQRLYGMDSWVPDDPCKGVWPHTVERYHGVNVVLSSKRSCWLLLCRVLTNPDIIRHILQYLHPSTIHLFNTALPSTFRDTIARPGKARDFNYGWYTNTKMNTDNKYPDKRIYDITSHWCGIYYIPTSGWERIRVAQFAYRSGLLSHIHHTGCKKCTVANPDPHYKIPTDYILRSNGLFHTVKFRFRQDLDARTCYAQVLAELSDTLNGKPIGVDEQDNKVYSVDSLMNQIDIVQELVKDSKIFSTEGTRLVGGYHLKYNLPYNHAPPKEERAHMDVITVARGWIPIYHSWSYSMRFAGRIIKRRKWHIIWTYVSVDRITERHFLNMFPEVDKPLQAWISRFDAYDHKQCIYNQIVKQPKSMGMRHANGMTNFKGGHIYRDNMFI